MNADIVPIKSQLFESGSKQLEPGGKYSGVCMASLLSSYSCISAYFDNIHLALSTHTYFKVLFYSMCSKYINAKNEFS